MDNDSGLSNYHKAGVNRSVETILNWPTRRFQVSQSRGSIKTTQNQIDKRILAIAHCAIFPFPPYLGKGFIK